MEIALGAFIFALALWGIKTAISAGEPERTPVCTGYNERGAPVCTPSRGQRLTGYQPEAANIANHEGYYQPGQIDAEEAPEWSAPQPQAVPSTPATDDWIRAAFERVNNSERDEHRF